MSRQKLTKKQHEFVKGMLNPDLHGLKEVAKNAGFGGDNLSIVGAITRRNLAGEIENAKQMAEKELDLSVKKRLEMLITLHKQATNEKDYPTACRTIENLLKVFGDYAPTRQQVSVDVETKSFELVARYSRDF